MRIIYSEVITSFLCIAYFYFKNVVKETAYKNVAFLVFRAPQLVLIRGKIFCEDRTTRYVSFIVFRNNTRRVCYPGQQSLVGFEFDKVK